MDIVIRLEIPATHEAAGVADRRLIERIQDLEAALKDAQRDHDSAREALAGHWHPGGSMAEGIQALRKELLGRLAYAFKAGSRWRSSLINSGFDVTVQEIEERAKAFAEGRWTP